MAFDPVSAALDIGGKLIDRLWPDPAQKADAQLKLLQLAQTGELAQLTSDTQLANAQIDVNKVEAGSANLFVSGWRPFVGWMGGVGFGYATLGQPLLTFGAQLAGSKIVAPTIETGLLVTVLGGLLGLGTMRTVEKLNGVATSLGGKILTPVKAVQAPAAPQDVNATEVPDSPAPSQRKGWFN